MAYQGFGRSLDKDIIKQLEDIATQGLKPDLTILLDIPISEIIKRRINQEEDRMEAEGEIFLNLVSNGFKSIAENENWIIIPAHKEQKIVNKEVQENLIKYLKV